MKGLKGLSVAHAHRSNLDDGADSRASLKTLIGRQLRRAEDDPQGTESPKPWRALKVTVFLALEVAREPATFLQVGARCTPACPPPINNLDAAFGPMAISERFKGSILKQMVPCTQPGLFTCPSGQSGQIGSCTRIHLLLERAEEVGRCQLKKTSVSPESLLPWQPNWV